MRLSGFKTLVDRTEKGEIRALSQLISELEKVGMNALGNSKLLNPPQMALRIGITGSQGSGKSTLIASLITQLRQKDLSVAVVAVDPSSPIHKGALLGDRIRYKDHFTDSKVFIRSLSSRGVLGGLNSSIYLIVRAFDLFGFDVVLIETTGVGQTEVEVMHIADQVALLLTPESGDTIQFMKAGLLEIPDQLIINKSDLKGVDQLIRYLKSQVRLKNEVLLSKNSKKEPQGNSPIFKITASLGEGVKEVADAYVKQLQSLRANLKSLKAWRKNRNSSYRLQKEAYFLIKNQFEEKIQKKLSKIHEPKDLAGFSSLSNLSSL